MAGIQIDGIDELIKKLDKLSDKSKVDAIAKKAVEAAQPISEAAMRQAIASVEYGPYATGSVSGSISSTPVKVNSYGAYAVARPTGRDAKGVRNGAKAAFLQYGAPHLSARPWRERAVGAAESECVRIIEETLKEEMELES